jgi:apolipoprotein N-acyltransferase
MDSKLDVRRGLAAAVAGALSAAAFWLATGLTPPWWAAWVAALPVLWVSTRLPWWAAGLLAALARILGGLSLWQYERQLIQLPLPAALAALLLPSLGFSAAVLLFRRLLMRQQPGYAAVAFASLLVACEYLGSLAFGTFGNTAYTQLDDLPVLQIASLTGLWGVSLVVLLPAAVLAAAAVTRGAPRRRLLAAVVVIYTLLLGYGAWRLRPVPPGGAGMPVALVETESPLFPQAVPEVMPLMRRYAAQAEGLARQGAAIIVLPEMTARVQDPALAAIDALFSQTARAANAEIILGVLHGTAGGAFNEARIYSPGARLRPLAVYRKHHLVPVLEGGTTPGSSTLLLPHAAGLIGVEICRDMDYAEPAGGYGRDGAGLVLVPAWDEGVDRRWHGHMALMRAVENGFSLVRVAKRGYLTVSDDRGRVLAERTTAAESFTTLLARVPVRHDVTLYQHWGDWFAWLDAAVLLAILANCYRRAPNARKALLREV